MRQENIFGGALAGGSTISRVIGKGHLNGLLIWHTTGYNHKITVRRRTTKGTKLLVSSIPLPYFARLTALEYGYDLSAAKAPYKIMSLLQNKGTITQADVDSFTTDTGFNGANTLVFVPLGSLYLGADNELDVQISLDPAMVTAQWVGVYTVSKDMVPDVMYQTEITLNPEGNQPAVDSIFLMSKATDITGQLMRNNAAIPDINCTVTDDQGQFMSDIRGFQAQTAIFESIEGDPIQNAFVVYRKRDAIPANVYLKLSGADAGLVDVLVRRVMYDQAAVSNNTVDQLKQLTERVGKLEKSDPETAKALRHAGEIAKAADLAATAAAAAKSNAADDASAKK